MAGDWIKMRASLFTHPKVVRISSALKADTLRTVGALMSVWCLFDAHSVDGKLEGYTAETLDDHLRWPGFAQAMISVCWLCDTSESLVLPEFETHNGASAKRRAQDADRKRGVRKTSAIEADEMRTREEKRRSKPPISPKGEKKPAIQFKSFLADCAAREEKPISEYKPVFEYADRVGLPDEFVQLAWYEFSRQFGDGGTDAAKKQSDWRCKFRKYVENNYLHLWWMNGETYELTTKGKQAKLANSERLAA